jgi:ssDNA-binding Zn-finger/Zn-ribbon topoisomerase 1
MTQKKLKVTEAKATVLKLCPKCLENGIESNVILISWKDKDTGEHHEFGACEVKKPQCGYTCTTLHGKLVSAICPNCNSDNMKPIVKKDGSQKFKCENCSEWYTADEKFKLVTPPECPKCNQSMKHRNKKTKPDEFYWGCFDCNIFSESDKFGAITEIEVTEEED